jgi:hypothetical protein
MFLLLHQPVTKDQILNNVTRTTSKIGPILSPDGKLIATDNEMAPEFNDYLCDLMTPSTIHHID